MAMTKASMAAKIKTAMAAVPAPASSSPADLEAYATAIREAMCQGIIEEITQHAVVNVTVTVDPITHAGSGTGTVVS